ncbi:MAG: GNAT family N-acetyltransferase [Phycisphaerales bacterium]|nr:GNAT family N-acetyltransferase [Phycisphaerales bacterium]
MIRLAETDEDRRRCFPVMVQLRPLLTQQSFVDQAGRQSANGGYRLAMLEDGGRVRAVAGFRVTENLFSGRHVYVDDLVTDESVRSNGLGGQLFDWLVEHAKSEGCVRFELDSGVQRGGAHRFYFQKRMHISSYRFRMELGLDESAR